MCSVPTMLPWPVNVDQSLNVASTNHMYDKGNVAYGSKSQARYKDVIPYAALYVWMINVMLMWLL